MRWCAPGLALAALSACSGIDSPDSYAVARAEAECAQLERCSLGEYEAAYSSDEDCIDDRADQLEQDGDALDDLDCTWLADEAKACVRRIRRLPCDDFVAGRAAAACDLVWACEDPALEDR